MPAFGSVLTDADIARLANRQRKTSKPNDP